ncbi:MAG: asparagine synthase (glutamine-hydrolyzing) [Lachnospiraceae bacterium]|nr:asparagine synthase (glutamine-hydrolyzing) [Lachnospiraceae bacterium]
MCGICGFFNVKSGNRTDEGVLSNMMKAIIHRGPDGSGKYIDENIALGFNRLSFIDLEGGMQPLYNGDGSVVMVCNGEVFNYRELKDELMAKGHIFRTKTDVEVIPHLYDEYGLDFPKYLNGQFAVALFDKKENKLILVRDQVGICPLYYTERDGRVIFGSEIKAILEYPEIPRRLNMKAVDQLMNFPGIVSPTTFFDGIYGIRAGHMLVFSPDKGSEDVEYWDMLYTEDIEDKGEEYYVENVKELFKKAVARRLDADVPIGFYISGGLDSSLVACYIGKFLLNSYYSFSAEIGTGELDESSFQKLVKECVKSEHYSVEITDEKITRLLPEVLYHTESAVKESYDVAAYLLSSLVEGSPAKAVLTGQGSDEFFCGYVGYMLDMFRGMQRGSMSGEELKYNEHLWGDKYFRYERIHPEIRKVHRQVYSKGYRDSIEEFSALKESPIDVNKVKGLSDAKRRSYIDYKLRLSDHLLIEHGDHMFFSHSVEGRHPFLDSELLKFVAQIPDEYKINGTDEKYILKRAGEGIVPKEILKRKKFPFQAQGMSMLIKNTDIADYIDDSLIRRYGIFDADFVSRMKKDYEKDDFKLMGAYEIDYLMIVMTVTMLCERFSLTV